MQPLPITLSKQYVMVSSIFNDDLVKSDDTEPHEFEATSKAEKASRISQKNLTIYSLNIHHMMKHFEELKLLLENDNPDIIGINETKLDETIHDSDIKISNYNIIRKDRDKFGGGIVMYIRESLNYKLRDDLDFDNESISAEVKVGNFRSFLVTSLYRPPKKPVEYFDRIKALISATEADRKDSIIIGDTNCDFLCDNSNDTRNLK